MQLLKQQFPKTGAWIESLEPFIVLRGEDNVVIKFADKREPLVFTYQELKDMEAKLTLGSTGLDATG